MHHLGAIGHTVSIGIGLTTQHKRWRGPTRLLNALVFLRSAPVSISAHAQRVGGSCSVCIYAPNSIPASLRASSSTTPMASPITSIKSVAITLRSPIAAAAIYPVNEWTATE